jgi:hypothetical protein
MKVERKVSNFSWKNGNGIAQNGNRIFLAEMETKQGFPAETDAETEFPFPANMEFCFRFCVHGPIQHAHYMTLSSLTSKADTPKIGDNVIDLCIPGVFHGLTFPY